MIELTAIGDSILHQQLLEDMTVFCRLMVNELHSRQLLDDAIEIDHACYRVSTTEKYEQFKKMFGQWGRLLTEAQVNGRPIATYKLFAPIHINDQYSVSLLELPAPKVGHEYRDGFEHVEVVVKGTLENFLLRYPNLQFNTSNLHAAINRDISLRLESGVVKFHESSLEQIIAEENNRISQH